MKGIQLFRPFFSRRQSTIEDPDERRRLLHNDRSLYPLAVVHLRLSSSCLPFRVRSLWGQSLAFALDKQWRIAINAERQHWSRLRFLHQLNRVPNSFSCKLSSYWFGLGENAKRKRKKLSEESDTAMYTGRARVWEGSWKIRQGHNYASVVLQVDGICSVLI